MSGTEGPCFDIWGGFLELRVSLLTFGRKSLIMNIYYNYHFSQNTSLWGVGGCRDGRSGTHVFHGPEHTALRTLESLFHVTELTRDRVNLWVGIFQRPVTLSFRTRTTFFFLVDFLEAYMAPQTWPLIHGSPLPRVSLELSIRERKKDFLEVVFLLIRPANEWRRCSGCIVWGFCDRTL